MNGNLVGVLGGMGPEATILLQQRLLRTVTPRDDADHIPLIIDMNPQIPSRITHLIDGTGPDPAPTLARMAQRLEAAGATALAMPCNTAHHYAPRIEEAVGIPLLNMVELSVAHAARIAREGARAGMLASPAVQKTGVFDPALARAGMTALWPRNMGRLLEAIRGIKSAGATAEARQALQDAADELSDGGAACLFVACSEFSMLAPELQGALPLVDTLDVLAWAIHDHSRSSAS